LTAEKTETENGENNGQTNIDEDTTTEPMIEYTIKYPYAEGQKNLSNIQMKTLRFIKHKKWELTKITGIIKLPQNEVDDLEQLREIGAELKPILSESNKSIDSEKKVSNHLQQKLDILNRLFSQAIDEDNEAVVNFLLENMTEDENKILMGDE